MSQDIREVDAKLLRVLINVGDWYPATNTENSSNPTVAS